MTDVRQILQSVLDTTLYPLGINSYWGERADITADEYVVYTVIDDRMTTFGNNKPRARTVQIQVNYYFRSALLKNQNGRDVVKSRQTAMIEALWDAGFSASFYDDVTPADEYSRVVSDISWWGGA